MEKLWNALRYGDSKTRRYIGGVILFSVLAIAFVIISGLSGKFGMFIWGLMFAVIAIIISQSFTLVDDNFVAEVNKDGKKDSIRTYKAEKTETSPDVGSSVKGKEKDSPPTKKKDEAHAEFEHYNQQMIKKIRRKYRIKKDHRPIIIDSSKSYHIKECPAFIWRAHNKVYLLLLEKEPRRICISRDLIPNMGYVPNVSCDISKEYRAFQKKCLITTVFEGFLPSYFEGKNQNKNLRYKNLYQIYPDIRISNRSAATVMDLLCLNFMPEDKITRSDKLNGYFKRVYAAHIMYQDRVLSITEYKDKVEHILKELCYGEIPMREFRVTLENLVKGRMISQEYADHYMDLKRKIDTKKHSQK